MHGLHQLRATQINSIQANVQLEATSSVSYPLSLVESSEFGSLWEAQIPMNGSAHAWWTVVAESENNAVQWPCTSRQVWNASLNNGLVINEAMPLNNSFMQDEAGGYADWVELYNAGNVPINLSYHYLTNRLDWPNRWSLPNVTLDPGQRVVLYCDDDVEDGPLHAPFHLDADSGDVFITTMDGEAWRLIDSAHWNGAAPNASWGEDNRRSTLLDLVFPIHRHPRRRPTLPMETWRMSYPKTRRLRTPGLLATHIEQGQPISMPHSSVWNLYQSNGVHIAAGESSQIPGNLLQPGAYIVHWNLLEPSSPQSHTILVQ